jgi:hypothetical protein
MMPRKIKDEFSNLILEGVNITRYAQEGNAIYTNNENHLDDILLRYQIWHSRIKNFLTLTNNDNIQWTKFYEADSVPYMKGGFEYGDIGSDKAQTLLKNIRIEASKKIELLTALGHSIFNKKLPATKIKNNDIIRLGQKNLFTFNSITGDTVLNKVKVTFPNGQQKFKFINTLLTSKEYHASYDDLNKAIGISHRNSLDKNKDIKQTLNRSIQDILKEIKQDLRILPKKQKNKKPNIDIFKNIENFGYRISIE